jgi:hypothetical protein
MNRRFKRARHEIPWRQLFSDRNTWALMLMFHFYMYGAHFFTGWLPIYLLEGRGFDRNQWSLEQVRVLRALADQGLPLDRIAAELKRSESATRNEACLHGISLRLSRSRAASI